MIGTELLQLLQGDPLAQMRSQMAPNPNPQMPQRPQTMPAPRTQPEIGAGQLPPGPLPGVRTPSTPAELRGAQVGPMPPLGAPPAPAGPAPAPPPAQPPAPPSVAPQSPPDLTQLYMRLMQQQRAGSAIDHGLSLMASAYAAPGTQGQIMHSLDNQQQDPGAMMNNLVQLQQLQQMQNAGPAITAALTGAGGGDGSGGSGLPASVINALPLETRLKMLDQQQQAAIALRQKQAEAGIDVSKSQQEAQGKDVEEFKNSGIQDFSAANQKLTDTQAGVDQLLNNMPATMKALSAPDILTTSKLASWNPIGYGQDVKQQAIAIQKLEAGLTGESLSNVKNVRNQREFNTLGEALTAGLNANNGEQGVRDALIAIKQKMMVAHAQVYATAGKQIPNQFAGLADTTYTSPTLNGKPNPYFTGATYEPPPQGGAAQPAADGSGKTYTYNPKTGQLE